MKNKALKLPEGHFEIDHNCSTCVYMPIGMTKTTMVEFVAREATAVIIIPKKETAAFIGKDK